MQYEVFRTLLTKDERKRVKDIAKSRGMTLSGYLTQLIRTDIKTESHASEA